MRWGSIVILRNHPYDNSWKVFLTTFRPEMGVTVDANANLNLWKDNTALLAHKLKSGPFFPEGFTEEQTFLFMLSLEIGLTWLDGVSTREIRPNSIVHGLGPGLCGNHVHGKWDDLFQGIFAWSILERQYIPQLPS